MNLVIVESPTKGNTIRKFLGPKYKVLASYGHIRDLPKHEIGIDIENNFNPKYIIIPKTKKNIQFLKKESQKAALVILATDEDREGEAIAYHLTYALNLDGAKSYQRIVFHEITKSAIEEALKNPRKIDINLVNAQQARRVLDRIVGYKLSPFLWKKVARRLSAGRVQSVAVRLVVEREREIENFLPQEYWTVEALLRPRGTNAEQKRGTDAENEFLSLLVKKDGKIIPKLGIKTKKEADKIVKDLKGAEVDETSVSSSRCADACVYKVIDIQKKEVKRNPLPPFTTSSLQQESWQRFRFSSKLTMSIAQKLYEQGFITYHRTDSLNLSDLSLFAAKKFIIKNYGKNYWAGFLRKYKAKGRAQEAHEAIRPTYPDNEPEKLKTKLDERQFKLYDLIWRRFIACQMAQACFDSTNIEIEAKTSNIEHRTSNYIFRATGQTLKFDGFLKVYPIKFKETELPVLKVKEILKLIKLNSSQHFTQPPPRYNEATLIKTLEENGIGRPSTYAPILSTIQERNYIEKDESRRFKPTEIGIVVNDLLVSHFPKIVDIKFTAQMEEDLDKIAMNQKEWVPVIKDFYNPFEENLQKKYKEVSKADITQKVDGKKCPKCGSEILIRLGKFGKFYACSAFPKCKYTASLEENDLKIKCPKCSAKGGSASGGKKAASKEASLAPSERGKIVTKRTKRGKIFYGCSNWPKCDFALWDKPLPGRQAGTGEICPKCKSLLVQTKRNQIKCSNRECRVRIEK